MKKLIVTIIFAAFISTILLMASENSLPSSKLYTVKRLKENVILRTKTSPEAKVSYLAVLLDLRLNELKAVSESQNRHSVLPASLRYSTTAGEYTEFIRQNNLKESSEEARKTFDKHKEILKQIVVGLKKKGVVDESDKHVSDAINYLIIYEDKLH